MAVGDGTWQKTVNGQSYKSGRVSYGSVDFELAARAGVLMARVLGKPTPYRPFWPKSNGVYVVNCGSKHFVEVLTGALRRFEESDSAISNPVSQRDLQ